MVVRVNVSVESESKVVQSLIIEYVKVSVIVEVKTKVKDKLVDGKVVRVVLSLIPDDVVVVVVVEVTVVVLETVVVVDEV